MDSGCNSIDEPQRDRERSVPVKSLLRKLRKINQSPTKQGLSQFWPTKHATNRYFGSCNGIVLCGIPYRGRGALASPHPTNRLLFPSGLGYLVQPGRSRSSTALKQLSESIIVRSHLQARVLIFLVNPVKPACFSCLLIFGITRFRSL